MIACLALNIYSNSCRRTAALRRRVQIEFQFCFCFLNRFYRIYRIFILGNMNLNTNRSWNITLLLYGISIRSEQLPCTMWKQSYFYSNDKKKQCLCKYENVRRYYLNYRWIAFEYMTIYLYYTINLRTVYVVARYI